jgi:ADP-ribose pyrophosphatase
MLEDLSPDTGAGFLRLSRRRLVARYPDGTVSEPFLYDTVDRQALDAVVIAAHYLAPDGRHVFLRSSIRPPIYYRAPDDSAEPAKRGQLWELPAGLVEPGEAGDSGLRRAAARELHEEAGFPLDGTRLSELGPALYPCPGVIAEKLFFFDIEVDPVTRSDPPLDGSALERFGDVVDVQLSFALSLCRRGDIEDVKTEIGLRRLSEKYS